MGVIQSVIEKSLRVGSLILTQTPIYKKQMALNVAKRDVEQAKNLADVKEDKESYKRLLEKQQKAYSLKPKEEDKKSIQEIKENISAIEESEKQQARDAALAVEKAREEREKKIRQQEFYKKFMGVLNDGNR